MTVQHKDLTGTDLHEPKGVAAASADTVYVANGAGSGSWQSFTSYISDTTPNNVVIVNSLSDFPTPAAGTITLAADTVYVIGADISSTDFFTMSDNTKITGNNLLSPTLTYTGTGSMFVGVDSSVDIEHIRITCPTAQAFDISETVGGTKIFQLKDVLIDDSVKAGTIDSLSTVVIENVGYIAVDDGFDFIGSTFIVTSLSKISLVSASPSFVGVDLGTSVHKTFEMQNIAMTAPGGSVGLSGAASNANITADYIGHVSGCEFNVGTALSGISVNDFRWSFKDNTEIQDTMADGLLSLTNNVTATTIATINTPVLVAGTWNIERQSHFAGTSAGRLTYAAERPIVLPIDVTLIVNPASGTNQDIRAYVAKNGSVVTNSGKTTRVDSGSPESVTLFWQDILETNDYIEVFIENKTGAVNVTVQDAILRIR